MTPSLDREQAAAASKAIADANYSLPVPAVEFVKVLDYTTFSAEVAIVGNDLVYHFFVTDEVNRLPNPQKYWHEQFPAVLEKVVPDYFKSGPQRLQAAYTEEQASWYLRAMGYGSRLNPHKFAYGLFDALDAALDLVMKSST